MKLAKNIGFFVCGVTSTFVITSSYIPNVQAASLNLVQNGSFEEDPLVDTDYDPTRTNPFITGWTNDSQFFGYYNNNLENYANTGYQSLHLGYTPDDEFAYLSQTLSTQKNKEYQLSFYLASAEEAPRLGNVFQVFIGGNLVLDLTNVSFQPFTLYQVNFVATSKSTELKFATQVKYDWLNLDDVSVYRVKNNENQQRISIASIQAIPETLSFAGTTVAGLLGVWLTRKKVTK